MKTLKPQPLRESDYADVQRQLEAIFYQIIFKPVVDLLAPHNKQIRVAAEKKFPSLRNAVEDPIVAALKSGQVQYANGVFSGNFNSRISKALKAVGAVFNKQTKTFTLAPNRVPPAVLAMAHTYEQTARKLHTELMKRLDKVEASLDDLVNVHVVDAGTMVSNVQRGFEKSVGDALGNKELSDESRAKLKAQYTDSLKPWIKKFSAETIGELREQVEANALAGYRADNLVKRIQSRYDVSKSKAEFLARQETALYVSAHRRTRFAESGITQYVWRTAGGPRVREDHRHLEGKIFSYAHPPIVDHATGRRGNPGQDFNCLLGSARINFAYGVEKIFKRRFNGEIVTVVTDSGAVLTATPNHPIISRLGWAPISALRAGDELATAGLPPGIDIGTLAETMQRLPELVCAGHGKPAQFHGDGADGEVSVIDVDPQTLLALDTQASLREGRVQIGADRTEGPLLAESLGASALSFSRVMSTQRNPYSGYVYNFQTPNGWYIADGVYVKNCRCVDSPVLPHANNFFTDKDAVIGDPDEVRNSLQTPQLQECAP